MEFSQAKYLDCFYMFILPSDLFWRSYDAKILETKCLFFEEVCPWVTTLCCWWVPCKGRKTQPSDAQQAETDDFCIPHQPGVLFTLLWGKGITPLSGGEEWPGTRKGEEVKPSSRGAALQASFSHPRMHFPPTPPPLATLQTAGPMTLGNVVALGSASPRRVPSPSHAHFQQWEQDASFKSFQVHRVLSASPTLWAAAEALYLCFTPTQGRKSLGQRTSLHIWR